MQKGEKTYYFYSGLWNSFFNRHFYTQIAVHWNLQGAFLLLLAVALSMIPYVITQKKVFEVQKQDVLYAASQMPELLIDTRGRAHAVNVKEPYFISAQDGGLIAIVDTTGNTTPAALQETGARLLITDENIYTRSSYSKTSYFEHRLGDYINGRDITVTPEIAREYVEWITGSLFSVIMVTTGMVFFTARMIQAVVYTFIGFAICYYMNMKMEFTALFQIAAAAIVPPLLLFALMPSVELAAGVSAIVGIGYLLFGIRAVRDALLAQERQEIIIT